MWQELSAVLKEIAEAYTELLDLSQKKRTVLVMVDLAKLDALLKDEEKVVAHIQEAESRRRAIVMKLSQSQSGIRPDSRMTDLYEYAPASLRPSLQQLHKELDTVIAQVKEAGDNNKVLISGALSAVNYQLNRLGKSVVEPAYGTRGQEVVSREKNFDFQA
mgnify:CR=1 FL=1